MSSTSFEANVSELRRLCQRANRTGFMIECGDFLARFGALYRTELYRAIGLSAAQWAELEDEVEACRELSAMLEGGAA